MAGIGHRRRARGSGPRPRSDGSRPKSPGHDSRSFAEDPAELRERLGEPADDQRAYLSADEVGRERVLTDTAVDEGVLEAEGGVVATDPKSAAIEWLTDLELRDGETDDPMEAAEEGLVYVPPTDPPVIPGDDGGPEIAAGFGASSRDEPFDLDHHSVTVPDDDEVAERVREAIRADAATSPYADEIDVESEGRVVTLRGRVPDLDDADSLVAAAEQVTGISQVVDELEVAGIG